MHFSHYCPQYNSKTNDPKVFKLGIGNDLGVSYKWYGLVQGGYDLNQVIFSDLNQFKS